VAQLRAVSPPSVGTLRSTKYFRKAVPSFLNKGLRIRIMRRKRGFISCNGGNRLSFKLFSLIYIVKINKILPSWDLFPCSSMHQLIFVFKATCPIYPFDKKQFSLKKRRQILSFSISHRIFLHPHLFEL
jgi:hypothetical protein